MKKGVIGWFFIVSLAISMPLVSISNAASAEEDALQTMSNWFTAFNNGDFDLMSSVWWQSPETTEFGPGVGAAILKEGWQTIGPDWKTSMDMPPGTYKNTMHHPKVTLLGDDVAIITHYNTSVYTDPATQAQSVSLVRGTFVIQKIKGEWLIVHEHSSMLPTE